MRKRSVHRIKLNARGYCEVRVARDPNPISLSNFGGRRLPKLREMRPVVASMDNDINLLYERGAAAVPVNITEVTRRQYTAHYMIGGEDTRCVVENMHMWQCDSDLVELEPKGVWISR
jgi:hypothetical protein